MIITGTAYFPTRADAVAYYVPYEGSRAAAVLAVRRKLSEGQIHIGQPKLKPGETAYVSDHRWHVRSP
jgi:hypothetical protein